QQQHGLFAVGFYTSALPVAPARPGTAAPVTDEPGDEVEAVAAAAEAAAAVEIPPPDQQTYVAQASAPADFSGEPVTPGDAHPAESVEDEREISPDAPSQEEGALAKAAPEEPETADQRASS